MRRHAQYSLYPVPPILPIEFVGILFFFPALSSFFHGIDYELFQRSDALLTRRDFTSDAHSSFSIGKHSILPPILYTCILFTWTSLVLLPYRLLAVPCVFIAVVHL